MNDWKSNLINAYRLTTAPLRAWQKSSMIRSGQLPVFVLFYHRVSDQYPTPWTISCRDFEMQIDWLEQNFQLVSLETAQQIIAGGCSRQPTLAITFDDGYAENLEFALPLLVERRIPVTYFVTLGNILEQRPFEHDLRLGQPLPVNSIDSIRAMVNAGIEIGAHTRNHVDLGQTSDPQVVFDEVIMSGRELAQTISQKIRYFAFPYGQSQNLNQTALQWLREEGYHGACTTLGAANPIGVDPFQINRTHGDPLLARVKNWLSFDPRYFNAYRFDHEKHKSNITLFPSQTDFSALSSSPSPSRCCQTQSITDP
jgi:peptidoglycan/xylan/chitin deacetylase (PgdA/CDA1 family)